MPAEKSQRPEMPCTGIEMLDYTVSQNGQQVLTYKSLAGGAARSSYTLVWYAHEQLFDVHADIADDWEELSREEFYQFHGEDERIWYFYD